MKTQCECPARKRRDIQAECALRIARYRLELGNRLFELQIEGIMRSWWTPSEFFDVLKGQWPSVPVNQSTS